MSTATGPTSVAGKARSSQNALSHGLTTRDLYVPATQQDEFEAMQQALEGHLRPSSPAEFLLFHDIVAASWRLRRCDQAEAQLSSPSGLDPLLDPALEPTLPTLDRTRTHASKLLHKSLAELRCLQTERQYRTAAMPAGDDGAADGFGLADTHLIRARLKKEEAADHLNFLRRRKVDRTQSNDHLDAMLAEAMKIPDVPNPWDDPEYYAAFEAARAAEIAKTNSPTGDPKAARAPPRKRKMKKRTPSALGGIEGATPGASRRHQARPGGRYPPESRKSRIEK